MNQCASVFLPEKWGYWLPHRLVGRSDTERLVSAMPFILSLTLTGERDGGVAGEHSPQRQVSGQHSYGISCVPLGGRTRVPEGLMGMLKATFIFFITYQRPSLPRAV